MSDSYHAVYDAVRSKISGCDIGQAVEQAVRDSGLGDQVRTVGWEFRNAAIELQEAITPSAIYRPAIYIDGNKWCALYGANLQEGVAGFGDSPVEAMADFNACWVKKINGQGVE